MNILKKVELVNVFVVIKQSEMIQMVGNVDISYPKFKEDPIKNLI